MTVTPNLRAALAAAALAASFAAPAFAEGAEVHDGRISAAFANAPAAAAYMVIHNHGGPDDRLVSASSPAAERVELHESVGGTDGVMRMEPRPDGLPLPTDGEIELAPGGLHIMMMGLTAPLEDGAMVPLTLTFEQSGELQLELPVHLGPDLAGHGHDGMEMMDEPAGD